MDICIIRGDFVQGVLGRYGFTARQRRKFPLLFYLIPGHWPGDVRPLHYRLFFTFNLHPLAYPFSFDSPAIHRYRWLPRILTTLRMLTAPNIQKMVNLYHYPSTVTTLRTGTTREGATTNRSSLLRPLAYPLSFDSPAIHRLVHTHTQADSHKQTEIKARWLPHIPTVLGIHSALRILITPHIHTDPDIQKMVNHYHYPSTVAIHTGTARESATTNRSLTFKPLAYPLSFDSPAIYRHVHTHTQADSPRQAEIKYRWLPRSLTALRTLTAPHILTTLRIPAALRILTAPDIRERVNHYHYPSTVTTLRTGPTAPDLDRVFGYPASRQAAPPLDYFTPAGPVRSERQYPLTAIGKQGKPGIERQPMTQAAEGHSPAASGIKGGASPPGIGLRQLTDQVYRLLERRIKTERERRGW